jgi:hypothetical protein
MNTPGNGNGDDLTESGAVRCAASELQSTPPRGC